MKYLTTSQMDLEYTDAGQTVQLADGRYGFCDGLGKVFARAVVMIPGHDYRYGEAVASPEHTNVHAALEAAGAWFPQGSKIRYTEIC